MFNMMCYVTASKGMLSDNVFYERYLQKSVIVLVTMSVLRQGSSAENYEALYKHLSQI